MTEHANLNDKYDRAYNVGYMDGFQGLSPNPPKDDSDINYRDGYTDGKFKREQENAS